MNPKTYIQVMVKSHRDLPKDILLHVGSKNGFEELVYY